MSKAIIVLLLNWASLPRIPAHTDPFPYSKLDANKAFNSVGCPLSPLFVLAIEPLAARISASEDLVGFRYGTLHEKRMLYADDMLVLQGDTDASLRTAMAVIADFGTYFGLTINWTKSALLPLEGIVDPSLHTLCPVPVVESFRYQGVVVSPDLTNYSRFNIMPLLTKFWDEVKLWKKIWLSTVGRDKLVKMILMLPIVLPLKLFQTINSIFRQLLWRQGSPRIHLEQLQKSKETGDIAFPNNPWVYYLAAQLQHMREGMLKLGPAVETRNSSLSIMLHHTRSASLPEDLESQLFAKSNRLFPTYRLMHKIWGKFKQLLEVTGFTNFSLIWNNTTYHELAKCIYAPNWGAYGITHMKHIFRAGKLLSFPSLQTL